MAGSRSERLLAGAGDALTASARVRLVEEATAGTLDPPSFARYLLIEEGFVHTAARILGAAVRHAPGWRAVTGHAASLHGLVTEQSDYFAEVRRDRPVPAEDAAACLRRAAPLSETALRAAEQGYPAIVTSLFAAEHLYATWCARAVDVPAARPDAVQEWIELHARPPFTDQVAFLRAEVDALGGDVSDGDVHHWFTAMLHAEDRFHDAVYA
ncbi:thiaminase/transcriptional activator TenA [Murinocardiopsis flavida]|uniref:Thiaminase/transcriptional activator TenA n=1 Tax=Murinocardiopsis flavida TaxID=645275 RepID=A0A2P8DRT9_9ACTN|nr:TenA family protein [Murinocardiopsis flavida]PSK99929.1 thiaminase/transcriptional activator TenA [Murinocardiopsis flavida]